MVTPPTEKWVVDYNSWGGGVSWGGGMSWCCQKGVCHSKIGGSVVCWRDVGNVLETFPAISRRRRSASIVVMPVWTEIMTVSEAVLHQHK